jgi:hypothetical protein
MSTKQEIIADLRKRARRCEIIADLYKADGDPLGTLQYLAESIASFEAAKAMALVSDYTAPHLWRLFENSRAQGRALARRKQPRPRRASPQSLLRLAARLRAEQLPQASNNESPRS